MLKRLEIFNAAVAALKQHPAIGPDRLIVNRSKEIAQEALPTVHLLWPSDRLTAKKVDACKRELTVVAEIYANGKNKDDQAEVLENAICDALLDLDKRLLNLLDINGPDADNDEENASFYEFCQVRLTFTITYVAPQRRRTI